MKTGRTVTLLLSLFLLLAVARADSIATLSVNAAFINSDHFPNSGPLFYLTGQFTLNESSQQITAWNMAFLGPLGITYQFSSGSGAVATAYCAHSAGLPCPDATAGTNPEDPGGFWDFSFTDNTALLQMDTVLAGGLSIRPFYEGEVLELCPLQNTYYPGGIDATSVACAYTSWIRFTKNSSFGDQTAYMYELADESRSSGFLTVRSVVSTPEPGESSMMLFGLALVLLMRHRRL